MPRAHGDETAVRHLFHSLDDPAALRTNALVAHLFEGTPPSVGGVPPFVRDTIRSAVERLGVGASADQRIHWQRHHAIVMRCDLDRDVHKQVAADLGLSPRHFYRERRAAHRRLAELLRDTASAGRGGARALERGELAGLYARSLREKGRLDDAVAVLQTLASESRTLDDKVGNLALAAEWLIDADRSDRAAGVLDATARFVEAAPLRARRKLEPRAAVARAALLWARGETDASRELGARALGDLCDAAGVEDRGLLAAGVAAALRHAANEDDLGYLRESLQALETADDLLVRMRPGPSDLHARHLALVSLLRAELFGEASSTTVAVDRALDYARERPFCGETVLAIVACSIHLEMNCGDAPGALRILRECLPFARAVCLPADVGLLYKRVAECEALNGSADAAKTYAARARDVLPRGSLGWVDAGCFEAMADLRRRCYGDAVEVASDAAADARRMKNQRRLGCALRLMAEGYAGLGRVAESTEAIEEAIALLERHTHSRALSRAYGISARITGNPRHRALAVELGAAVRA